MSTNKNICSIVLRHHAVQRSDHSDRRTHQRHHLRRAEGRDRRAPTRPVEAAAAHRALRARTPARPGARHRRPRVARGERGAAVGDGPLRQRARLRRLLARCSRCSASHLVERSRQLPRAHRPAAARAAQGARRPGGVLHAVRRRRDRRAAASSKSTSTSAGSTPRSTCSPRAPQIHVLAQRRAFPVACYLAYALGQLELRASLLDGVGGMLRELAPRIGAARRCCWSSSFRNYTPEVIEIARRAHGARRRGDRASPTAALSPLKRRADVCFELGDDSTGRSARWWRRSCLAQALVSAPATSSTEQRRSRRAAQTRKRAPR